MRVTLPWGDGSVEAELPDDATVVRYGQTYRDALSPPEDPRSALLRALREPLGLPPLRSLAGPGRTAVIGFPDRVKGGSHATAHRRLSIPLIIEELLAGGCALRDITLLCCMGLHRKNTEAEWREYLGDDIVDLVGVANIVNHDAEDPTLLELGHDAMGNAVQCNRLIAEADIPIVLGHVAGNPYGGFSGGYKMIATGISGWRSIASHHCPQTMHRDDWLGASPRSRMRVQFSSIGEWMEQQIGKPFFAVDAVLGQGSQPVAFAAGRIAAVEKATWPLATRLTEIQLPQREKADVLVFGLPRSFHYGPGMGSDPLLMALAISGQVSRCWGAFKEGGVVIAAAVCDGWINEQWFPSYRKTYEAYLRHGSAEDFLASQDAYELVIDERYRQMYRDAYAYHPFHAMSMLSGGAVARKRCAAVFVAGAREPGFAQGMGFQAAPSVEAALEHARAIVGAQARVLCTPECFSGQGPIHLQLASA